jgi:acyl-CoA thioester hydrolase
MNHTEPFTLQTRVGFIDTDASGRIHNTAMFRYFEAAETEFMRRLGIEYKGSNYLFPRVHVECDFVFPIVYDDLVCVEISLTKLGNSSMRFDFRTFKSGDLAAKGAVVMVCVDRTTQNSITIPNELREKLEPVLSAQAEENSDR